MKRAVTTFFSLTVLLTFGTLSYGQQIQHSASIKQPRMMQPVNPEAKLQVPSPFTQKQSNPFFNHLSPLVAEDSISYFQDNGFSLWPAGDTLLDQTGNPLTAPTGSPYVRFLDLERFDAPGTKPFLDSIHIAFIADTLMTGSHLVVSLMVVDTLPFVDSTTGETIYLPLPWANGPIGTTPKTISIGKIHLHEVVDTVVKWKPALALDVSDTLGQYAGSFAVGISSFTFGNRLLVIADSTNNPPSTPLNPVVDRSYWVAYSADGKYFTRGFWGGRYYTDATTQESVYYPNFLMTAYTHDANAAVEPAGNAISSLGACVPNPVATTTQIDYSVQTPGLVSLKLYNAIGEEVATLVNHVQGAGEQSLEFNAASLTNGIYYYKLQSGDYTATRMMVVNK
ncbi:MAG: T9SS type A sorting domain-containing protein [Bacteroidota bacterium]|nr:T9SS type A sorting domain-containing protein [Bacteroidota bacterium]MDP4232368.1 T9SS type A sorting domain-containing protein [Bacteroidota bacterium]MDP4241505.1 T9SS type A sorting domain-containing protein [Bacteroidota bacterium]MDP4288997.1 T9SS type A sorting domain-containing protein [Bacteroidota bacterium]